MIPAATRLRVVLVIAQLGLGGTEQQVALLATALRDSGHDVVVVLLFHDGPHAVALRAAGVDVRGPLAPPGRVAPLVALVRLVALLRRLRPDVMHAFLLAACAVAAPASLLARVPVRVAGRRSLGDWKDGRPAVVALEWVTNHAYVAFVANAQAVASDAVRRERIPAARMHVVRNALPSMDAPPDVAVDDPGRDLPRPLVLCVANLIDYKGHRHLLEAQRLLQDEGCAFGLLLAGEGPERERLTEQAALHGLPVRFLGARTDVPALLALADLVVLPSLHEGMSNALMEAMALGRAVVATDVGGNREVLGDAGVLCAAGDSWALAEGLRSVVTDAGRRAELADRAGRRAVEQFSLSRMCDAHLALYRELLDSRAARRATMTLTYGERTSRTEERAHVSAQQEIQSGERFAFGDNWARFLAEVDDRRIQAAKDSLTEALGRKDLTGVRFLDAGCGSGLFSLAAHMLGAEVVCFDFDAASVGCAQELRERYGDPSRTWTISQGSVLDPTFLRSLGTFDVVYSWGVLHHTGAMWDALALIEANVAPGGQLFISVYNDQGLPSRAWTRVKRRYNSAGPLGRQLMLTAARGFFGSQKAVAKVLSAQARATSGPRPRGMSDDTDLIDWVGGYPFEVAKPEQVFEFYRDRGYVLLHLKTCRGGHGCNEYVLQKSDA